MRRDATEEISRGARRRLAEEGFESLLEFAPTRGLRADLFGVGPAGEIWIVEVKSCWEDYAADAKWPGYLDWCDAFFFAVGGDFPSARLPEEAGLIRADRFEAEVLRRPASRKLAPARRRALLLKVARLGAARLRALQDPGVAGLRSEPESRSEPET